MDNIWLYIGIYLGIGLVVVIVFDITTSRVRRHVKTASSEARDKMAATGTIVGRNESLLIVLLAVWILWPAVLIGAMDNKKRRVDKTNGD